MTLKQFINKYNGKFVEVGGSANALNQCVDLVNAYIVEVLNLSKILWTNAVDFPSKAGEAYTWIPNTNKGVPLAGDIIIWEDALRGPGHIAIFVDGNINGFHSFDQNYPIGSKAHIQSHNYNRVLGWLRKEGLTMSQYNDLVKVTNNLDKAIKGIFETDKDQGKKISEINKALSDVVKAIERLESNIVDLRANRRITHTEDEKEAIGIITKIINFFKKG